MMQFTPAVVYLPFITREADDVTLIAHDPQNCSATSQECQGQENLPPFAWATSWKNSRDTPQPILPSQLHTAACCGQCTPIYQDLGLGAIHTHRPRAVSILDASVIAFCLPVVLNQAPHFCFKVLSKGDIAHKRQP